ncbi:MAG TPA: ABC transporter ATP-binding protein [Candidatus Saccharimonadales bacterium]|nr:ABC transporter ATP-binding protein [Candidatus Saccharimonadales bacterium]
MITDEEIAIKVERVSKTFKLPHEKYSSIKSILLNFYRRNRSFELQKALSDISFEVKKGEFFGIVGRNGSGKSTLLKLLAGIYSPDSGTIDITGKLTPFIELGVGFSPELTGRENVFLNGALFGFNRKEVTAMYDDIVAFAEIERFMDQKLKNYSSGMQVRLAFSIAIRAQSEILILDEVLAVGDMDFQQKCFDYFRTLKKSPRTVILVTHDMSAVLKFCDRAMLINDGKILEIAKPKQIADSYVDMNFEKKQTATAQSGEQTEHHRDNAYVKSITITQKGKAKNKFDSGETCDISINFVNPKHEALHLGFQIFTNEGVYCYGTNTKYGGVEPTKKEKGSATISLDLDLMPGQYTITGATMSEDVVNVYDYKPNAAAFLIKKTTDDEGIANLKHSWKM